MRIFSRFVHDSDRRNAGPAVARRQSCRPRQVGRPLRREGPPPYCRPKKARRRRSPAAAAPAPPDPVHGADRRAAEAQHRRDNLWRPQDRLKAIAQKKDRAALARLVLAKDFFWLKEDGNAAGKKTGIEALATALSLAAKDGSGWETLGELVSDETAAPYPDRPNTVCSPSGPQFKVEDLKNWSRRPRPTSATGASRRRRTSR